MYFNQFPVIDLPATGANIPDICTMSGRPEPAAHPFAPRAQSFSREIVGAGGALLNAGRHNVFAVHLPLFAQQEHGDIRFDGIPQGVGHLEHRPVHIRDANHRTVCITRLILNFNKQL